MTEVEARRPGTKGALLRLSGLTVAVVGYGRRPRSRRGGQRPRANSCGTAASSGCGGVWTTTEVEARRPRTKGELLRLGGLQWLWWGMDDDRGPGAAAKDQWPTPAPRWPAVRGWRDG